jgi:hypothetical protein
VSAGTLNRAQRVVIVIGLAVALYVLGGWVTSLGSHPPSGWVAYGPLSTQETFGGLHPWVRLVVWVALVALWVVSSVAILAGRSSRSAQ